MESQNKKILHLIQLNKNFLNVIFCPLLTGLTYDLEPLNRRLPVNLVSKEILLKENNI